MNTEEKDAAYIAHTYSRYPVCFVKGKGSHLTDENGKDYIDLGSGITMYPTCSTQNLWQTWRR